MSTKAFVLGLIALTSLSSFATEVKEARSNDIATKYILEDDGDFFRVVKGIKCEITKEVESFKVSEHKHDVAMAYFKKNGNLYILKNMGDKSSHCPKADTNVLVRNIKKYTVVSNTDTEIVNLTLDKSGEFLGWGNNKALVKAHNVKDYLNNTCFGSKDKSYNSYVAFGITVFGEILKIKGNDVGESKASKGYYSSVQDFKEHNNVCK